jgi:hypothetical protein
MTRTALGLLAAAIALSAGGQAAAKIITVTYTGTVSSGGDGEGLFGKAGADLTGDAYVATFTVNTANGVYMDIPAYEDVIDGGAYYGDSSPVTATLEINNSTQSLAGLYSSYAEDSPYYDLTSAGVLDESVSGSLVSEDLLYVTANGAYNNSILDSLTLSNTFNNGEALFGIYDTDTNQYVEETFLELNNFGTAQISGVPEPATWAMMLVGVGAVGAVLRRRQKRGAVAA